MTCFQGGQRKLGFPKTFLEPKLLPLFHQAFCPEQRVVLSILGPSLCFPLSILHLSHQEVRTLTLVHRPFFVYSEMIIVLGPAGLWGHSDAQVAGFSSAMGAISRSQSGLWSGFSFSGRHTKKKSLLSSVELLMMCVEVFDHRLKLMGDFLLISL